MMFASLRVLISTSALALLTFTSKETTGQRITSEEAAAVVNYEERYMTRTESQQSTVAIETDVCDYDEKDKTSSWDPDLVITGQRATIIDDHLVSIPAKAFATGMQIQVMILIVLLGSMELLHCYKCLKCYTEIYREISNTRQT